MRRKERKKEKNERKMNTLFDELQLILNSYLYSQHHEKGSTFLFFDEIIEFRIITN